MGKNLRNILIVLVASFGLLLAFFANPTTSKAATQYDTNDFLTGISIKQKNYGTASNIDLTLNWDTKGKELHNGDTWVIDLPNTLSVKKAGESFPLTDKDGNTIGTAVLNADNTITVTFTDVEGKGDFSGSLNIKDGVVPGKDSIIGDNNVVIGDFNDNMTVINPEMDFSKKGVIDTDENGDAIITWSILVNRNSADFPNLKIYETITDDQTFIPGSINVYEAAWNESKPGYYNKTQLLSEDQYKLAMNNDNTCFTLSGLPKENQFYVVTFQTKINDPANATNGYKFRNHADFTWGNGSGTNGGINQGIADASVSGNSNSGSGDGNTVKGSVTLTKENANEDSNNEVLKGAVYDLYEVGSDTPIKTGLTTDENGQLTVTDLAKGNYYFKETKAPEGFEINGNEVPFTISGTTTTPVTVTAKDEPTPGESEEKQDSIVVMKLDAETGYRLAGAEFEILDEQGNSIGTFTTDSLGIGHYYNLPLGKYTLKETKAPEGYIGGKDYKFEITDENPTPALISIDNEEISELDDLYSVDLQKFDRSDMTTAVPGAEYTLYDENGQALVTKTTDENGILSVDGLKPGNYYFLESKAPEGFELNPDKLHFTIQNGSENVDTVVTSDPKINEDGSVTTPDVDENDDEDEDDNNGGGNGNNGNNGNNEGNGNEEDKDDNGGIIVDPEHPNTDNNSNDEGGIITIPGTSANTNSNNNGASTSNNATLPQTGNQTNLIASLIGLVLLSGIVYFKRRNA